MENFGQRLLEQRMEREQSLAALVEYQKEAVAGPQGESGDRQEIGPIQAALSGKTEGEPQLAEPVELAADGSTRDTDRSAVWIAAALILLASIAIPISSATAFALFALTLTLSITP